MKVSVGFTGTREGLTPQQMVVLRKMLESMHENAIEFHHGDCLGADAQARNIAFSLGARIISHPPKDPKNRAWMGWHEERPAKDYAARNRDIVDNTEMLFACPKHAIEELRSGTWMTIRYARKQGKPLIIVYPDGSNSGTGE